MGDFCREMTSNIFGNPHSAASSSLLSGRRVDDARLKALRFFNADSEEFDLVFVANATAAIKLVAEAMRDFDTRGFWYGYQMEAHTSLVGVRQLAEQGRRCFVGDEEVDEWITRLAEEGAEEQESIPRLFAYPAQSNMTGRRLPLSWCGSIREAAASSGRNNVFSLLDAASLVSTSPLDLSDLSSAPDFTALSFYKIFGFPDLGALIVRKSAAHLFERRKYFGGGTVSMVINFGEDCRVKKDTSIHDHLEDGTLPVHNIIALDCAIEVHKRLYGSMENVSRHTSALCQVLFNRLSSLKHANGRSVCDIYTSPTSRYGDWSTQGPLISFNLKDSEGNWVGKSDIEKLAAVKDVEIRTGTLCNPGGTAFHLKLTDVEMKRNFAAGVRCGNDMDVVGGKPTGQIRVSLGAMTTMGDIERFMEVVDEFYVDKSTAAISLHHAESLPASEPGQTALSSRFYIDQICLYPIKSCGGFVVPEGKPWQIKPEGLAWDREWCLIHQGTGSALNQKRYPRMALLRPFIDLERGVLRVSRAIPGANQVEEDAIEVSLSRAEDAGTIATAEMCQNSKSLTVCGDRVVVHVYLSAKISEFFSSFLGVPCTLARFPLQSSERYSKSWHRPRQRKEISPESRWPSSSSTMPGSFPEPETSPPVKTHLLLSNESPILLVSRSSVNKLNEIIKAAPKQHGNTKTATPKAVSADVFRANIIVAEEIPRFSPVPNDTAAPGLALPPPSRTAAEHPYIEDAWRDFHIGPHKFDVLGPCARCQMVCVDQRTGVRSEEPFSTLSKTRKTDGKVLFGRHVTLSSAVEDRQGSRSSSFSSANSQAFSYPSAAGSDGGVWVRVGDLIAPEYGLASEPP
jgi:molybdenum cofactor sulfurtransferase